jgi:hypothetical protein
MVCRKYRLATLAVLAVLLTSCGDGDTCGVYSSGNVTVVKTCDTTDNGGGSAVDDQKPLR